MTKAIGRVIGKMVSTVHDETYWRFNGAYEVLEWSMHVVTDGLQELQSLHPKITKLWDDIHQAYPDWDGNITTDPTHSIVDHGDTLRAMWVAEDKVICGTRTAITMAAIHFETTLNAFCYYNLGGVATEAIERLDWLAKVEMIHASRQMKPFKGTAPYESTKALQNWRNAFMHGKNPDQRANTLKENHLVKSASPIRRTTASAMNEATLVLQHVLRALNHLKSLNKAPEMDYLADEPSLLEWVGQVSKYVFSATGRVNSTRL